MQTKFGFNQYNKPAPVWLRKGKKVFSNLENLVIGILLLTGFTNDSLVLLIIKLSSNFVLENLEILFGNGQVYTPTDEEMAHPSDNGENKPDKP